SATITAEEPGPGNSLTFRVIAGNGSVAKLAGSSNQATISWTAREQDVNKTVKLTVEVTDSFGQSDVRTYYAMVIHHHDGDSQPYLYPPIAYDVTYAVPADAPLDLPGPYYVDYGLKDHVSGTSGVSYTIVLVHGPQHAAIVGGVAQFELNADGS